MNHRKRIWSMVALAGLSTTAIANWQPQTAPQLRKGEANRLSIPLSGLRAAFVEVEVDGVVVATRHLTGRLETLTLHLRNAGLAPGIHNAVVKIYDAHGRLLSQRTMPLELLPDPNSPLTIIVPRNGTQVAGTVPIEARVNRRDSVYVSFFVDGQIRGLRNYPPYVYNWDTTRESNGWHTLEVWSYDGNQTLRTPPMRVYVNNPGGRTEREALPELTPEAEPAVQVAKSELTTPEDALRPAETLETRPSESTRLSAPKGPSETPAELPSEPSVVPALPEPAFTDTVNGSAPAQPSPSRVSPPLEEPRLIAPATTPTQRAREWRGIPTEPQMRGQKLRAPQVALAPTTPKSAAPNAEGMLMRVEYGTRLPAGVAQFEVVLDAAPITFDVAPTVESGVALLPIRHMLEPLGARLRWDNQTKTATLTVGGRTAVLRMRENTMTIDGTPTPLEAPLRIVRGRVLIPATALSALLDAELLYDTATEQLILNTDRE
ncbi:MAG: stalk domain-containing protein [Fimbriimonadales bacterium]